MGNIKSKISLIVILSILLSFSLVLAYTWCKVIAYNTSDVVGQYTSNDFYNGSTQDYIGISSNYESLSYLMYYYCDPSLGCCPSSENWNASSIDNRKAYYTSLKYDSGSSVVPKISYHDPTDSILRYANYVGGGSGNCSDKDWNCTTVDATANVGEYSSLELESETNYPRIAYYDSSNQNLKFAYYLGNGKGNCTDKDWCCTTVDSQAEADVGKWSSLELDIGEYQDKPRITYYDDTSNNLKLAYCNSGLTTCDSSTSCTDSSNWTIGTAHRISATDVGSYSSFSIDASGNYHISYYDATNQDAEYAWCTPSSGNSYCTNYGFASNYAEVNTSGNIGKYTSITTDSSNNPRFSYQDDTNNYLMFGYCDDWSSSNCDTGTDWSNDTVDNTADVGYWTSTTLDDNEDPLISYTLYSSGSDYDLKHAEGGQEQGPIIPQFLTRFIIILTGALSLFLFFLFIKKKIIDKRRNNISK